MRRTSTALLALALSYAGPAVPRQIGLEYLENVHEIAPGVLTGAGPHGEKSFEDLAAQGVKTAISVSSVAAAPASPPGPPAGGPAGEGGGCGPGEA